MNLNAGAFRLFQPSPTMLIVGIAALLAGFGLSACESDSGTASANEEFETLAAAHNFAIPDSGTLHITTREQWLELWNLYWTETDNTGEKTPPPEIDFETSMVVGVHYGMKTGCSGAVETIESVTLSQGQIWVLLVDLPDLGPCDAIVHPIHLVVMAKHDLGVRFVGQVPE